MKNLQNCIDEAIVNDPKACSIVCDINYHLARHGMPLLAVSSSHKVMGEKGNLTIGIDRDEFTLLGTFSTDEAIRLTELAAKIHQRGNYPYPPINVILSGNTRKGMLSGETDGRDDGPQTQKPPLQRAIPRQALRGQGPIHYRLRTACGRAEAGLPETLYGCYRTERRK